MKARLVSTIIAFLLATTAFAQYPEAIFTYDSSNMQFAVPIHKGSLAIDVQDSTLYFITEDYISTDKLDDAIAAGHTVKISGAGASFDPSTLEDSLLQHRTDINWLLNNLQADSLYIRYMTDVDTTSGWKRNDTVNIPVTSPGTDYSWNYQQGTYEAEITNGDAVDFKGYSGINLFSRSLAGGGAQLGIAASQPDQWFDYQVIWVSGWTYYISSGYFFKNGEYYSTSDTTITLDAADATHPRIDVFAVDTNETVVKITGTPAADPVMPTVDPESQLFLTFRYVQAGATEPTIDTDLVYNENEEWTTSSSATTDVTVDFANATSPQNGDSCIYISHDTGGSISGANMTFTAAANDTTDGQSLTFYMRSSDAWSRGTRLGIFLLNGTTTIGAKTLNRMGNMYGFDDTDNSWQRISINLDDFNLTGNIFNKIYFKMATFPAGNILSFDYIELQGTSDPPATGYNLLTQNNTTRTSLSIPLDNAAYISASGLYNVGKNTSNVPTGVEGALIAIYNSTATAGMIFQLIDEDSGDVYTSVDKGANWTQVGGGSSSPWTKSGNHVYPETIGDSVGIGTVTPTAALEVDGQAIIDSIRLNNDNRYFIHGSSYPIVKTTNVGADEQFIVENSSGIHVLEVNQNANEFFSKLYAWRSASGQVNLLTIDNTYATCGAMEFYNGKYGGNAIIFDGTPTWGGVQQKISALANGDDGATYGGSAIEGKQGTLYFHANNTVDLITVSSSMITAATDFRISSPTVPSSKTDTGTPGQIAWDANYFYWCTSTNVWERAPKDPTW